MKTIGLIGGMSWESSAVYYRILNEKVRDILGGFHSAKCIMVSVDFAEIEKLQRSGDWDELNKLMVDAAKQLEAAGADIILICTNTMHLCSDEIKKNTSIPLIHIARASAEQITKQNITKVALLGTKYTMEKDFYKSVLKEYGIDTIIPTEPDRLLVHNIIFNELVKGIFTKESRAEYQRIIKDLTNQGAEGVILGCTEIPLLIRQEDVEIPIFDTTKIHAEKAVKWALSE